MLSKRLKIARNNAGLTQDDVVAHLKVIRQTYSAYETGRSTPDPETLLKLASLFNVSASFLLGETDDPTPPGKRGELNSQKIEDVIKNSSDLSEESQKDLLKQLELLRMRDKMRKMNEAVSEELRRD